jgi:hypothetical protein
MGGLGSSLGAFAWKAAGLMTVLALVTQGTDSVKDAAGGLFNMFRVVAAESSMNGFHKVFQSFYIREERFPATGDELYRWIQESYDDPPEVVGTDPWETRYWFLNSRWEVMSAGPDKQYQSEDDLIQNYGTGVRSPPGEGWAIQ